jgi:phage shock protein A
VKNLHYLVNSGQQDANILYVFENVRYTVFSSLLVQWRKIMALFAFGFIEGIFGAVVLLALIGGALWFINSRYLKVNFKVVKANLGKAASDVEAANAVNLMKQGIQECVEQVSKAKAGLVKVQGSIAGLERQVNSQSVEENRLSARISTAITGGKTNDDPVLKQLALSIKRIREDLKTNREQLEVQHGIYNDLLAQVGAAQKRAETLQQEAESMGAQLETSKLTAELSDLANSFSTQGLNNSLEGVQKYRDLVRQQIDSNNAKMKVNRDLGGSGSEVQAWEAEQDASDVLAEFRAAKPA